MPASPRHIQTRNAHSGPRQREKRAVRLLAGAARTTAFVLLFLLGAEGASRAVVWYEDRTAAPRTDAPDAEKADEGFSAETVDALQTFCEAQGNGFSAVLLDPESGAYFGWNEHAVYYAASTLKAPYALWLAARADAGEIDLDESLDNTYRGQLAGSWLDGYNDADAVPARAAVEAMLGNSDNQALRLLATRWPAAEDGEFVDFLHGIGMTDATGCSLTEKGIHGYTSAADGAAAMAALYRYAASGAANAGWLTDCFCAADHDVLYVPDGVRAAKKYGSWDGAFHDQALVFARRTYVVSCYTDRGDRNIDFPPAAVEVMQQFGRLAYDRMEN